MTGTLLSKIKLYVGAYATVFALAAFCLLCFHDRHADNPNLNDNSWKEGLHTNRTLMRDSDPLSLTYAGLKWTSSAFNCSVMSEIENLELVGAGWTKAVYRGLWKNRTVAIKTLNLEGYDMAKCSQEGLPLASCRDRAAAKILREIALLTELQHTNIIKVLGTCIPAWDGASVEGIAVVTEFGDPLDTIRLLQMNFEKRLKLALDAAQILHHLAHSPLGSLALLDFRKQQFVLVDNVLKLSDVDDIGVPDLICQQDGGYDQGTEYIPSQQPADQSGARGKNTLNVHRAGSNLRVSRLQDATCRDQGERHEKHNIQKAGKLFIEDILIHGSPRDLHDQLRDLALAYACTNLHYKWNTSKILHFTKNMYETYMATKPSDRA